MPLPLSHHPLDVLLARMDFRGRRVTIMGLGHFGGGVAAARWLARQGAHVTVTDLADATVLAKPLRELADVSLDAYHLGGQGLDGLGCDEQGCDACWADDFRRADLVVVNPAVRPENRWLRVAAASGARLTTEIGLFLDACPAPIIAVTGSNGKSTTAAMIAAILRADGRRTWLGGNIGGSLLDRLDQGGNGRDDGPRHDAEGHTGESRIGVDDWVVLELSSFQLHHLGSVSELASGTELASESPGEKRWPRVAVVTNCTPNHLDWHPDWEHYRASKQRLLVRQASDAIAVLNTDDPTVASWRHLVRGQCLTPVACSTIPSLRIPGLHNRVNAACAAAAAMAIGCSQTAMLHALQTFETLPQRLRPIATVARRTFYDDAAATTPESTIAALHALHALKCPVWLLAGGRDKGCDLGPLAATIAEKTRGVAFFGDVGPALHDAVRRCALSPPSMDTKTLPDALAWCWNRAKPDETILLSPACASDSAFRNYRHRAEVFAALVATLAAEND